ncbi:phage terminase small subunit P27 family [Thermoactinomyces sp. DSM 45892]|uniref:phage terminase small subunit P27 family n=1 Tax=Thermoactinomyces sp. DSM 45892 TaxID=1882753 RepID=UPI000898DBC5|nr:phage terminase small subunit P27 family [Thermoactinomyces sp. DSM 45892]SDY69212.1 phage terminase, small subunit, putative, P27 family [Thermoactinomyces sp. DSM 45892]
MAKRAMSARLQLVQGNPNKRNTDELKKRAEQEGKLTAKSDKVKPPKHLDKAAKKKFNEVTKELLALDSDMCSNLDVDALAMYAQLYSEFIYMTEVINQEGYVVGTKAHPLLGKRKNIEDQLLRIGNYFGLNPESRARLARRTAKQNEDTEEKDMFG